MKPSIFVTRTLPEAGLTKLKEHFEVTVNRDDRVLEKQEIIQGLQNKDALLCLLTDTIDKEVMDASPNLKVISNYAVGFNNIDLQEATRRKIPVCITPGILTNATADLTFALILSVARRIVEADHYLREGKFTGWSPNMFLGSDLEGKTLGIIGMGRIGEAVARRALGFDMKVVYYSRTPKNLPTLTCLPFETLLRTSDIITVHTPLTPDTRHLIGETQLKWMKNSALLINTTRGPVVDEKALVQALRTHEIAGAGLDVFEKEPKITPGLIELKNTVLLPHIGSATVETRSKMAVLAAENAIAIINHQKPHAIANAEVLG